MYAISRCAVTSMTMFWLIWWRFLLFYEFGLSKSEQDCYYLVSEFLCFIAILLLCSEEQCIIGRIQYDSVCSTKVDGTFITSPPTTLSPKRPKVYQRSNLDKNRTFLSKKYTFMVFTLLYPNCCKFLIILILLCKIKFSAIFE